MANATNPRFKAWKANGTSPAAGYYLYTYESGTTTPKTTYSDNALATPNANPIVLDANGEAVIFLGSGAYRFDLKTPAGALVWTFDPVQGSAAGLSSVDSIAELKALSTQGKTFIQVLGYYAPNDGGGGLFYYDTTSTAADDSGTVIIPNSAPATGRWKRLVYGEVSIRYFGAKGDGSTDDGAAMTAANTYVQGLTNGGVLLFPASTGGYRYTSAKTFGTKVWVRMENGAMFASNSSALTFSGGFIGGGLCKHFDSTVGTVRFALSSSFAKVFNVLPEWFGATGDGSTDDTSPVQKTIDSATQTTTAVPVDRGFSRTKVVLSSIYAVTATIAVRNKFGFAIEGSGSKRQCGLLWTGAISTTAVVFETSNVYYCRFSGFSIDGNSRAGITHRLDNLNIPGSGNTYSIGTHENFFEELMCLGSTELALEIGYSGTRPGSVLINNQIDWCYWNNCHFSSSKKLVKVEGSNTFHLYFRGGEMNDFTGYGVYLLNGGQVHLDGIGMSCGGTPGAAPVGTYFYRSTNFGTFTVSRCQQEGNALTLEAPDDSASANHSPVLFKANNFGYTGATELALTAYKLVDYRQRGYFRSEGDKWGMNPTNSVKGQLYFAPPGAASLVQLDGLRIVSSECEVVQSGNTVVSGFSKDGILTACLRFFLGTRVGRTIAGFTGHFQLEKVGERAVMSVSTNADEADAGSLLLLQKSRGTSLGANTVVQNDDTIGGVIFAGANGSNSDNSIASIIAKVDGTVTGGGANDMPGRLEIATCPDGSGDAVKRWAVNNVGMLIGYTATGVERVRIDPLTGRILQSVPAAAGTAIAARTISGASVPTQQETTSAAGASFVRNSNDATGPQITLAKTRATAIGTNTIVQNGDQIGVVKFSPADGSDLDGSGASIEAVINGTPAANDLPTDIVLSTTRAGNNDPAETLRLTTEGYTKPAGRVTGTRASVVSANDLTLPNANVINVTSTTAINRINTTGWPAGSRVILHFESTPTVTHQGVATAGSLARVNLNGSANFVATAGSSLELFYDGTDWYENARRVP